MTYNENFPQEVRSAGSRRRFRNPFHPRPVDIHARADALAGIVTQRHPGIGVVVDLDDDFTFVSLTGPTGSWSGEWVAWTPVDVLVPAVAALVEAANKRRDFTRVVTREGEAYIATKDAK